MDYIDRNKSLITGKNNLEHLYTFKDFPVFMGCVDNPLEKDYLADMVWNICPETGLIQLAKLVPLDIVYLDQHNDGIGSVWSKHYQEFAEFVKKNNDGHNILEIGGAHDVIANNYFALDPQAQWTTVEPNPKYINNNRIKIIKGLFDNKFVSAQKFDTVVHSHVFEHVYDPFAFMQHIGNFLQIGQKQIFAFPNFLPMLEKKQTNCLNFEHTVFLTEHITEYILQSCGFRVIDKKYFGDPHSIFYATTKVAEPKKLPVLINKYIEYKQLYLDFVNFHLDMVRDLNSRLDNSVNSSYLFGAHIFSQFLIKFGLQTKKITTVLDNSSIKIGKRLYGTSFIVDSPKIITNKGKVNVILKAGIYNEEIKKDILENINDQVVFW
jgi:hypothetical protein